MKLESDPACGEVLISGSAAELSALARAVAAGEGFVGADAGSTPSGIEARRTSGPGVLVHLDLEQRVLLISGDAAARAVLAENLQAMAEEEDGGHLHVDWYPGHYYLAEGSIPLVVDSPHGGMPVRR
ncbi:MULTISPECIES: hypothetical protein [unclassified Kitasatospora]|uniref:Imm32 family immunity protein n=1 Tax=unclassified Kitasatospora TaxID=2633591 RepID=UPI00070ADA0D|nr:MULTISPECIES: hypothetical protein [unclassified Kitasatospora]KQV18615.1 hypothetical protein ASC99_05175 [Kitasatospora sp. Root107]KRB74597.1 hypothetical protein ASE03_19110 [Kitasatospora sp. Root187]